MRFGLAALLCALVLNSLTYAQEQPETARPTGGRRGGAPVRPETPIAGRQLTFEVLIADTAQALVNPTAAKVLELEKAGNLLAVTRLRAVTLDELPVFVQIGGRSGSRTTPIAGRGGPGGPPNTDRGSFVSPNTGVQFQATPRIEEDGSVVVQIYIERPESAVPAKAIAADASDEMRRSFMFLSQNTVRVKSDEPRLISGRQSAAGNEGSQTWIVLTATVDSAAPRR